MDLINKKCIPCEGGVLPFTKSEAEKLLQEIPGWELNRAVQKISREFKFKNFVEALAFVNKAGEIAENEGHHPDIKLSYGKVRIEVWTHTIFGLSENDFILAAKINDIKK